MTRQEFLEYAAKQSYYNNKELTQYNIDNLQEKLGSNSDFIFNFLCRDGFNGELSIVRLEDNGFDWLHFIFTARSKETFYWEDIEQFVAAVVSISIYNCQAEEFYRSQDGRFWDENHKLRFETEEELFDYLVTVKYEHHPSISEKTYEMLRHFGWHKGRCIDTTEFEKELKNQGIILSQIQLDTIREFSGLEFSFSRCHDNFKFYSQNQMIEMLNNNSLEFTSEVYDCTQTRLLGRNVLEFGANDMQILSISERGEIFLDGISPFFRNALEYIHQNCRNLDKDVKWL